MVAVSHIDGFIRRPFDEVPKFSKIKFHYDFIHSMFTRIKYRVILSSSNRTCPHIFALIKIILWLNLCTKFPALFPVQVFSDWVDGITISTKFGTIKWTSMHWEKSTRKNYNANKQLAISISFIRHIQHTFNTILSLT